jgi:glycosyltransferase involved in cell wall biosynthesis
MKIVLFSPVVVQSAIGRMAASVVKVLQDKGHQVSVVRSENISAQGQQNHDFRSKLIPWQDAASVQKLLAEADFAIYQIGNSYEFHAGCIEWLKVFPGLVCLHDFFLGHLFYVYASGREAEAQAILKTWYSAQIASTYFTHNSTEGFIEGTRKTAPMTEWICSHAQAVITHSGWGVQRVLDSCPGPVAIVPLAYEALGTAQKVKDTALKNAKLRVLTIGHVNPNKRVESVIRAISQSEFLRKACLYQIAGPVEASMAQELSTLAKELGVEIAVLGRVNDEQLHKLINEADVISCLRWPSLEAASASAIEAMLYGKATIVTDTGFYQDIPDNLVLKVDPTDEITSLRSALQTLLENESFRLDMGQRAQIWSQKTFTADNYANQILEIGQKINRVRNILHSADHFSLILESWKASPLICESPHLLLPLELFNEVS